MNADLIWVPTKNAHLFSNQMTFNLGLYVNHHSNHFQTVSLKYQVDVEDEETVFKQRYSVTTGQ